MRSVTGWETGFSSLLGLSKTTKSRTSEGLCSEKVFRNFVSREAMRGEQAGQLYRILLVCYENAHGQVLPLVSERADQIVSLLSHRCRDTDYIGWYQQDLILGVLLTALKPDATREVYDKLTSRLMEALRGATLSTDDYSLKIQVLEPGELS